MRRFVRYAVYVLVVVLSLMLLLDTLQRFKIDHFYVERPILHAMRSVHDGVWSNDSEPTRSVLLQRVPLGTESGSAVAALARESFGCQTGSTHFDENSRKPHGPGSLVNCQLLAPARWGYNRWLIDLSFDEDKRLLDAKVAIWNTFL